MFDPSKPVQTRDGRPARIICTDRKKKSLGIGEKPIIALINTGGYEFVATYFPDGKHLNSSKPAATT